MFQIVYQNCETDGREIHWFYHAEARAMEEAGIRVGIHPLENATKLLRRGFSLQEESHPSDPRYVNDARGYFNYKYVRNWYPPIADLTIPTFFVDDLDDDTINQVEQRGWDKAFIKDSSKSLYYESIDKCIWPTTTLHEIKEGLAKHGNKGGFSIRQCLDSSLFEEERRYFVIKGVVHHSSGRIPAVVHEAAGRLNALGSVFYVIDATSDLVVEVNPGESSDRSAMNRIEDFTRWIKDAFDE